MSVAFGTKAPSLAAMRGWHKADLAFALFVFLIASNGFTALGLHSLFWAAAYGYALLRFVTVPQAMLALAQRNWIFLAYPALCALSVLWSHAPIETLRFAAQLMASTVIALLIGRACRPQDLCRLVCVALGLLAGASLANVDGGLVRGFDHRGNFVGIFESKNALGHRAVMLTASAVAILLLLRRQGWLWRLGGFLSIMVVGYLVSRAGSATATMLCLVAGMLVPLTWLLRTRPAARALAPGLGMMLLAGLLYSVNVLEVDPWARLLDAVNRDSTLTGRTLMWAFGVEAWLDRPFLGHAALGIWNDPAYANRILGVQAFYGAGVLGFHNLTLELLVMLGPLGLAVHSAALTVALRRSGRQLAAGHPCGAWAVTTLLALVVMAQFGPQLHNPHGIPWILVTALAASLAAHTPTGRDDGA
ncbi:MAG: O-antigen ligase family protein [Pseudomonadota bacterium]